MRCALPNFAFIDKTKAFDRKRLAARFNQLVSKQLSKNHKGYTFIARTMHKFVRSYISHKSNFCEPLNWIACLFFCGQPSVGNKLL